MAKGTDRVDSEPDLGTRALLRRLTADDCSALRYVHETAVRHLSNEVLTDEDVAEWGQFVRSPAYSDRLMNSRNIGAWYDGQLLGTGGWRPSRDDAKVARITALYVQPVFANCGIGGRLLAAVESEATAAGFTDFSVRSIQNAAGFFQTHGYRISSYGIRVISPRLSIPVTFMRKSRQSAERPVEPVCSAGASLPRSRPRKAPAS